MGTYSQKRSVSHTPRQVSKPQEKQASGITPAVPTSFPLEPPHSVEHKKYVELRPRRAPEVNFLPSRGIIGGEEEFRAVEPPKVDISVPEELFVQAEDGEWTGATTSPKAQTSLAETTAATSTKVPDLLKRTPSSQVPHTSVAQTQN